MPQTDTGRPSVELERLRRVEGNRDFTLVKEYTAIDFGFAILVYGEQTERHAPIDTAIWSGLE